MRFPRAFPESLVGSACWKAVPEDFLVEELPALTPQPQGPFALVEVRKRDLSTPVLLRAVADQAGLARGQVCAAGFKDRSATTRQWISLPAAFAGARPELPELLDWRLVGYTPQPLRPGQLQGNRFRLTLRECSLTAPQLQALWARQRPLGWANYYGVQRFGEQPHYQESALQMLRRPPPKSLRRRWPHNFELSSLTAELFNRFLERRVAEGRFLLARPGDWCRQGQIEVRFEGEVAQQRALATFELTPLGPIWGYKLAEPTLEELRLLEELGLEPQSFRPFRAPGSRRPLRLPLPDLELEALDEGVLRCSFELPPGSYATVLLGHFFQEGNFRTSSSVVEAAEVLDVTDKNEATPPASSA